MVKRVRTDRTSITMSKGLRDQAHAHGINISALAAAAVSECLKNKTGAGRQAQTPVTATCEGRASECQLQKC